MNNKELKEELTQEDIDKYLRNSFESLPMGTIDDNTLSVCHKAKCRFYQRGDGSIYSKCNECDKECKTINIRKNNLYIKDLVEFYETQLKAKDKDLNEIHDIWLDGMFQKGWDHVSSKQADNYKKKLRDRFGLSPQQQKREEDEDGALKYATSNNALNKLRKRK